MELVVIISCLLLCAFFSGMEIAFVSSNKIYLEIEKKQENFIAKIIAKLTQKPSKFLATMLVGNSLSLVIYGFLMGDLISNQLLQLPFRVSQVSVLLIQIVISTIVIVLTAEFLPKVFFQIYANKLVRFFAIPAYFFYQLFNFFSTFILWISDFILKQFFKTNEHFVTSFFSKTELEHYINEQMLAADNENIDSEIQIFQNALEFSAVKARDIMTPRTELVAFDMYHSITDLRLLFIKTGYSKILIYQNSLDDIVGYVHSFELFKKPKTIKSVMIPVEYVPETILIKDTLNLLTKKRKSVAVVLDEYGGTSGIITVEDIVEELFGEIEDEHDEIEAFTEIQMEENRFIFSARLDVEYLNEKYNLAIPESDSYGTLGGYIVNSTKSIPKKEDLIAIDNFQFIIQEATNTKIEVVKMIIFDQK
jgi:CBS domain containing-hemolysin-like protein